MPRFVSKVESSGINQCDHTQYNVYVTKEDEYKDQQAIRIRRGQVTSIRSNLFCFEKKLCR